MSQPPSKSDAFASWWGQLIGAAGSAFMAWSCYSEFSQLEAGTKTEIWMPRVCSNLYQLTGKWPLVGFFAVLTACFIGFAAQKFISQKTLID
ncbi:MAG: hypothetical protein JSS02_18430 [Planctomycetes bacterium]|nr:hypothetical protein [Planctomycetota bacterium]